ncbi:phospholipid-translocating P-type ATPase protein [Rutstroemia sp. NJR-2017a WRK4]|nr:phospholipid-translocating P-type ATPase protein [Rutstroemia sp. NJR-2017a WRK4]
MAGQPFNNRDDLLLDLHDEQPIYNNGQRAPMNDDDLLRAYNADHDASNPRPSISYDNFVGAPSPSTPSTTSHLPGGPGYVANPPRPPYLSGTTASYSQTSGLNNYQRYADDLDDFPEDGHSEYYHGSAIPGDGTGARANGRNRNSIMSLGGGIMGKAKSMFGMAPEYSEMDLPLTESGTRNRGVSDAHEPETPVQSGKKFDMGNFKFGFGRGKPDPSTLGPRIIHLNNPPANSANKYVDNHISTAKYNVATFVPKFLFEQFSKFANLFFLFTAALQQIPNISPTNQYTTIGPLILVLLVSAGKEAVEDYRRKTSDNSLNNSKARVLRGSQFTDTKWINVAVGDIVRVESEESFPADIVLLASSEPEGLCYIETANLDGETNLKIKQAIPETCVMVSSSELSRLGGRLRSEQPNSSLYTYEGTLTMAAGGGEKELPLQPDQLLLRGATLRNTPWIHGVVVFTGHETKLMRNATATPIKRTAVERQLNILVLMLVAILIILSVISSVGDLLIRTFKGDELSYLGYSISLSAMEKVSQFWSDIATYWVLYSALVPISLFVTIEMVKYWHAILINDDLDMYYEKMDTPAVCRTSSLVEELGMVEYIFSDKTGTLTCNQMEFKQCSIGGIQYAEVVPEDRRATNIDGTEVGIHDFKRLKENQKNHETALAIHHFLALLATCHTVIPERVEEKGGTIKYQAASPDEGALVEGAVLMGYQFTAHAIRTQGDGTIAMETLALLLLVHGAWSYQRVSKVILYSFYKNITLYMTQFWYSFQNTFSGEVIYESWTLSFYNVFFTVLPPLAMGIFDQFISARLLDRYPQLYQLGQKNTFFKMHSFWSWVGNGFYHSLILYVASELIWWRDLPQGDGKTAGHWVWGAGLYTAVLATVLGKAALVVNIWTKYHFIAIPGSMAFWMLFLAVYGTVAPKLGFSEEYEGVVPRLFESPVFWLQGLALPALCLSRDFAWKYAKRMYYPQSYHHIQEIQKYNIQDYRPRMEQFQKAIRKVRQVQRMRKQRGYAFSQADESQTRVLQAYDTTKERGRYGEMASSKRNR